MSTTPEQSSKVSPHQAGIVKLVHNSESPQDETPQHSVTSHGCSLGTLAGISRVSDPPLFNPTLDDLAEDSETSEALAIRTQQQLWMEQKDRDIEYLELTREQLTEMVDSANGLTTNEFFDGKFLKDAMNACWADRMVIDESTNEPVARLWPSEQSPMRHVTKDDVVSAPVESAQFERRHPMMFRNVQRNRARRQLFNESMHAAQSEGDTTSVSATGSALTTTAQSGTVSLSAATMSEGELTAAMSDVRSRVMAAPPLRKPPTWNSPPTQQGGTSTTHSASSRKKKPTTMATAASPETAEATPEGQDVVAEKSEAGDGEEKAEKEKKPPTLSELLSQQKSMMAANDKKDAEEYRPLLASFFKYEENAQRKLDQLATEGFGTMPQKPNGNDEQQSQLNGGEEDGDHPNPTLRGERNGSK